jgi:membrane protease YdiL (CAAX protease family)
LKEGIVRKQLIIFFVIFIILSIIFQYLAISSGKLMPWVIGIMWSPGIAALAARLIVQKNLRNLGWGWGKTRYQLISYLLPLVFCIIVYGIVWLARLGIFSSDAYSSLVSRQFGLETPLSFGLSLLIMITVGMLLSLVTALGEEIGWRGFLVPELYKMTSFTKTSIIIGIIWAVWHYPGILYTGYYSGDKPWYAIPCFTLMVIGLSFIMSWLRLKSGSLWTAAILHASHNIFIQAVFDPLTKRTAATEYITTEFGIGMAVIYCIAAYFFWRKRSALPKAK